MSAALGGSTSKSNFSGGGNFRNYVDPTQQKYLADLYGKSKDTYGDKTNTAMLKALSKNIGGKTNELTNRSLYNRNYLAKGGDYQSMALANNLRKTLNTSLSRPSETALIYSKMMGGKGNTYADAMKASFTADANRVKDNLLATTDARAADAGMSGSSRHGIVQSKGLYDINSNLQKNLADVGYNTFDKDLQNKLGIAQQADQNTLARQQLMSEMLGEQNRTRSETLDKTPNFQNNIMSNFSPYMLPWQNVSNYKNALGSPLVLAEGQSKNRGKSEGKGMGTSGGLK